MLPPGDFLLLGAGGKMGQGIAELLLATIAEEALSTGIFSRRLTLVDPLSDRLVLLKHRLEKTARTFAERSIVSLRKKFQEGTSNREKVENFASYLLDQCFFERGIEGVRGELFVFEAAAEDVQIKTELFSRLAKQLPKNALFFTNTSAIPIASLAKPIPGRLAGLHFYNPPPLQPIVEVVIPKDGDKALLTTIEALLAGWKKERVDSPDIVGFIGNGFMIPEIENALSLLPKLSVDQINQLTKEKLFRPLGIFELVDFVGRDIVVAIGKVMGKDLTGVLNLPPTKRSTHHRKKMTEEEAIAEINKENNPSVHAYLEMLKKISSDLFCKGVDQKALEKVLKLGFHHTFVPWDTRLKA